MHRRPAAACLAVAALLAAALSTPAAATPTGPAGDAADRARQHQRVIDFWTVERVRSAVPRDFVKTDRGFEQRAKPSDGGGGSAGKASSWTQGGTVLATTGKVLFTMGTSTYVCTAGVVTEHVTDRSLAMTAAHCVFDESTGAFATNWVFVPDYDSAPAALTTSGSFCAQTTKGCWTANALAVHAGYASAGGFTTQAALHDWGFAVLGEGGKTSAHLDTVVGSQPVSFSAVSGSPTVHAFGYPASGRYKGTDLAYCLGQLTSDPRSGGQAYGVGCTMTGGSSGGPWFADFAEAGGTGTQMSVNSYGYNGVKVMYGPVLDARTEATFDRALTTAAGSNVVVP